MACTFFSFPILLSIMPITLNKIKMQAWHDNLPRYCTCFVMHGTGFEPHSYWAGESFGASISFFSLPLSLCLMFLALYIWKMSVGPHAALSDNKNNWKGQGLPDSRQNHLNWDSGMLLARHRNPDRVLPSSKTDTWWVAMLVPGVASSSMVLNWAPSCFSSLFLLTDSKLPCEGDIVLSYCEFWNSESFWFIGQSLRLINSKLQNFWAVYLKIRLWWTGDGVPGRTPYCVQGPMFKTLVPTCGRQEKHWSSATGVFVFPSFLSPPPSVSICPSK